MPAWWTICPTAMPLNSTPPTPRLIPLTLMAPSPSPSAAIMQTKSMFSTMLFIQSSSSVPLIPVLFGPLRRFLELPHPFAVRQRRNCTLTHGLAQSRPRLLHALRRLILELHEIFPEENSQFFRLSIIARRTGPGASWIKDLGRHSRTLRRQKESKDRFWPHGHSFDRTIECRPQKGSGKFD